MAGRSAYDDPLKGFLFRIEVEGFVRAGFSECTGLEAATEIIEYREGGDNTTVRKSQGLTSFPNITLKRGRLSGSSKGGDDEMEAWFEAGFRMNSGGASMEPRKTVDIVLYHRNGDEAERYRLYEALSANYKPFGDLNATNNDDLIEELEIAFEGFQRVA